jgi:hypothetical protein
MEMYGQLQGPGNRTFGDIASDNSIERLGGPKNHTRVLEETVSCPSRKISTYILAIQLLAIPNLTQLKVNLVHSASALSIQSSYYNISFPSPYLCQRSMKMFPHQILRKCYASRGHHNVAQPQTNQYPPIMMHSSVQTHLLTQISIYFKAVD